jgi:hypothetical protein
MKFNPKDAEFPILPVGDYDAVVKDAQPAVSKSGNDMIKLTVDVFNGIDVVQMTTYLASAFSAKQFCYATGLEDLFNAGEIRPPYCIGRKCRVATKHEEWEGQKRSKIDKFKARIGGAQQPDNAPRPSDALAFEPVAAAPPTDDIPF